MPGPNAETDMPDSLLVSSSLDSLRVLPAAEAFPGSTLLAPSEPETALARALTDWGDSPINDILIVVFTIITVLYLRRLVGILPYLVRGLWRWREVPALEASMRLSRDRSSFALVMIVPFCLVLSRYDLFPIRFLADWDPGLRTLAFVGLFAFYALLRQFLVRVAEPRRMNYDTYRMAAISGYNYFIVLTLLLVATAGIATLAGVNELTLKKILLYEIAVVFAVFLLRRTQILSNACNQLTAFLYLCALEILPAGLLVASALIF